MSLVGCLRALFSRRITRKSARSLSTLSLETLHGERFERRLAMAGILAPEVAEVIATAAAVAPSVPTNVHATAGDATLQLTWTAPSNGGAAITHYYVRLSTNGGTSWSTQDTLSTATSKSWTNATNGTAYVFAVAAANSVGTGSYSSWSNSATPATTPGPVNTLTATSGEGSVLVSWTAPADNGGAPITDYTVQYKDSTMVNWLSFVDGVSSATSMTVTGLTNGTAYQFRVISTNRVGDTYPVKTATATPLGRPSAPPTLTAVDRVRSLDVSWESPIDDGGVSVTDYVVQYASVGSLSAGDTNRDGLVDVLDVGGIMGSGKYDTAAPASWDDGDFTGDGVLDILDISSFISTGLFDKGSYVQTGVPAWLTFTHAASTSRALSISPLAVDTFYVLRIAAVNSIGTGQYTDATGPFLSVSAARPPSPPTNVVAIPADSRVALAWSAPDSDGNAAITDYVVQYSTTLGASWTTYSHKASPQSSIAVTSLTNGTNYLFRVAAVNAAGTGAFSDPVGPVVPSIIPVPSAPSGVTLSSGNATLAVSWTASSTPNDVASYVIQRSTDSGATWGGNISVPAGTLSTTLTGLANGTSYWVRVAAANSAGTAQYSSMSLPAIPTATSSSNELWHNASPAYAVAVWTAVDQYGVGLGSPVVMNAGASAYPMAYTGGSRTLYLAIAPSANLTSGWYTVIDPNLRVTITDAQQITFWVDGWTGSAWQVSVNNRKTSPMY